MPYLGRFFVKSIVKELLLEVRAWRFGGGALQRCEGHVAGRGRLHLAVRDGFHKDEQDRCKHAIGMTERLRFHLENQLSGLGVYRRYVVSRGAQLEAGNRSCGGCNRAEPGDLPVPNIYLPQEICGDLDLEPARFEVAGSSGS